MIKRKSVVVEWAQKTKKFREELLASLQKLGQFCKGDYAEAILILSWCNRKTRAKIAEELLTRFGIAVKYLPHMGTEKEFLRMTVGSQEINQKLMYALRRVVSN